MKLVGTAGLTLMLLTTATAQAGRSRQEYVDGCQSVDGRYVVTAELVGGKPKDPKAGKWTYLWTDTKTKQSHTGDLVGLPPVGAFAHMFMAPDGETFAVWSPFAFCPGSPAPIGKLRNGGKLGEGTEKDWADHTAFAHRLVIYRKTGDIVKSFSIKDLLNSPEMGAVFRQFDTVRWVAEFPGLAFSSAPRVGYGTYRVSPDYTILEFKTPKVGKDQGARIVRVDLTTGKLLDPTAALGEAKTPVRPFQGPDRITQDEQYLWQPSLDPVRIAGAFKNAAREAPRPIPPLPSIDDAPK
jgi:hypothetical protein